MSKFWEVEEVLDTRYFSKKEQFCERNFLNTTIRNATSGFIVALSLKQSTDMLGYLVEGGKAIFFTREKNGKK